MLGLAFAEVFGVAVFERLFNFGALLGLTSLVSEAPAIAASITIAAKLAGTALVGAIVLSRAGQSWRDIGYAGFRPATLVLVFFPLVAALTVFLSEIDNLLRFLFRGDGLSALDVMPELDSLVSASWLGPLLAIVIAPVVEEIAFRGLILRGLLGRWPAWIAIFVSATLFALMHMNPAQFPIAFCLGAALGWVYARTRSLGLCILGHAINNSATYWLDAIPFEVDNYNRIPDVEGTFFHPWWFNAGALALFAMSLWLLHRLAPAATAWLLPPSSHRSHAEPPLLAPPPLAGEHSGNGHCQAPPLLNTPPPMSAELAQLVTSLAQRARAASLLLATAPRTQKDAALEKLADLLDASHLQLMEANQRDLLSPEATALSPAARERLTLSEKKLHQLAQSVREVVALPDPVGAVLDETTRPNGLRIRKLRVPIGVIAIIFEARPNVTIDCAILCLKSGNASILRGGKECFHTNMALAGLIQAALTHAGLPADAVQLVPTTDRAALATLLKLDTLIHCVIPRGGESLIRYVAENSTIPVIKHYKGVCFVYVDQQADLAMAEAIVVNAKVSRPSVCNAAEQLLVHRAIADRALPQLARALVAKNVQLRCDVASAQILARENVPTTPAVPTDYTMEFLDYVIAVRVVDSLESAIETINRDSSNHSDAIVTNDEPTAKRFLAGVDSATVYWNASTRFTDGFEFGYGAEIGISTDRLHARGPMGLPELCSYKFVIEGTGQVRT
jgi:glutamate-5-semialdehyde dehydrogenase